MKKLFAFVLILMMAFAAAAEGSFVPALDTDTSCAISVVGHYSNFEALENAFNRFNQFYPDVDMNYTALDDYNKIISVTLTSDEAPDIFFTFPWMFGREDYQTVIDTAEDLTLDLSSIRPSLIYTDAEGHAPILPIFISTYGMLVNETIFESLGLAVPTTYEELVSTCEALQAAGYQSPMMGYNRGSFLIYPLYYPYFCSEIIGNETAIADLNAMKPEAGEYMRNALNLAADFMSRGFIDLEACNQMENDYDAVIMRFFEGDVPMMLASGGTVSGTQKREALSEAFYANPFAYSFHPVPSTEAGGYFLSTVSLGFSVNRNSANLDMANEFIRFLVSTDELNRMAQVKRMVTPCKDMSLDGVYASFGALSEDHVINQADLGLQDAPDTQVRRAGWQVSNGLLSVDEAVAAFGTLED